MTVIYQCEMCGKYVDYAKSWISCNGRSDGQRVPTGSACWDVCEECHKKIWNFIMGFRDNKGEM